MASIISATKYPSSRRTPSFSSSSSSSSSSATLSSSYFQDDSPLSPVVPVRFSGVPFSWERLPGIPKKLQNHKNKESIKLLPLPPPATPPTSRKSILRKLLSRKKTSTASTVAPVGAEIFRKDPFFTALVECSKDDDDDENKSWRAAGAKVTRSISDRFGFGNLCFKKSYSVSESILYLPSASSRTDNYGLINRGSR
ncbi:Protease-associated RING/U-box zinc finger family protein [Hibiscus syriacus]|uniref:Protease-associated RING/U-box zinc finger family protein n=1 Tax=Hibiscus syriacus TaxID=106335 RepID=A0A6A3AHG5_HIBSY|nr:uncharacterized protein LOC120128847 [Hibiscus syriacus]KAE8702705.1 Protease-associated RING/U-box zinc finger family protein [Hibiscus syriacus]